MSESVKRSYDNNDLRQRRSETTKHYWDNPLNKEKILGKNNVMYGKHHTDETKKKNKRYKKE